MIKEKSRLYSPLNSMFNPKSIAVVGASSNIKNMGSRTLKLIKDFGFNGNLFAVNPKEEASHGVEAYQNIQDIKTPIDFCIIAVPAIKVLDVIRDCVEKSVPIAQILSSGLDKEFIDGKSVEQELLEVTKNKIRLVGPNCVGTYSSEGKLTLVSNAETQSGEVSICSQSGGLSIEMILKAKNKGLLLSKLVSMGNAIDLDPVDFLDYFSNDPKTKVIGFYLEGIKRGEEFFKLLKQVTPKKPVVILKGGKTQLGSEFAASHTNSLAGEYSIWKTAMNQSGAIVVDNLDEFISVMIALQSFVPLPKGKEIALAGNGGGATVLATDALDRTYLALAKVDEKNNLVNSELPAGSSIEGATVDIPANALYKDSGDKIKNLFNNILKENSVKGLILHFNLLPFISYDDPEHIINGICKTLKGLANDDKPIYLSLTSTSDPKIEEFRLNILKAAQDVNLPCFQSPQEAINTMNIIYKWKSQPLIESSYKNYDKFEIQNKEASLIIKNAITKGYNLLPQGDAYKILEIYGVPHLPVKVVNNENDAISVAEEIGYPVAMKIDSQDVIHKSDVGGVKLGINGKSEVINAFNDIYNSVKSNNSSANIDGIIVQKMSGKTLVEMICGIKSDPVFGRTIVTGMGGVLVELLNDISMRILPISRKEIKHMLDELKSSKLLKGYRDRPEADVDSLIDLIYRVAIMGKVLPNIKEIDFNPVMVMKKGKGALVADCRIIIG